MQVETHVLGPTLMPRFLMPRFYRALTRRLSQGGPVQHHAMPEWGGLGRTDHVVDHFRPLVEAAAAKRRKVRLAGHSLGGLVAWVLAHDYPYAIDIAELWCTPVRGTALANVTVPVAESRFLARNSRWIRRYDRPVAHTRVRAIYTTLDQLAVPPRYACYLEGDQVENVVVSPYRLRKRDRRPNEHLHVGAAEHVTLPRLASVNRWLAATA
jgi:pimeloyl-ACP methyl ester carboxylesterase